MNSLENEVVYSTDKETNDETKLGKEKKEDEELKLHAEGERKNWRQTESLLRSLGFGGLKEIDSTYTQALKERNEKFEVDKIPVLKNIYNDNTKHGHSSLTEEYIATPEGLIPSAILYEEVGHDLRVGNWDSKKGIIYPIDEKKIKPCLKELFTTPDSSSDFENLYIFSEGALLTEGCYNGLWTNDMCDSCRPVGLEEKIFLCAVNDDKNEGKRDEFFVVIKNDEKEPRGGKLVYDKSIIENLKKSE